MRGSYTIRISNSRMLYEFTIRRNITVVCGDSATGKTELYNMIQSYRNSSGEDSGVSITCDVPCRILTSDDWENSLKTIENSIVFIDEGNRFITSTDFARAIRGSSNYYVIITREHLSNIPYSVEEIYGIRSSNKYAGLKKTYNEFFHLYGEIDYSSDISPDHIIVEDSNSGYEFFSAISDSENYIVSSASGKANLLGKVQKLGKEKMIIVIADGAAFGSEMAKMMRLVSNRKNIVLFLPESFEWLILKSGIVDDAELPKILESPEDYIDSERFFSWEQYFTRLLVDTTTDTYLHYSKSKLNEVYLHPDNAKKIKNIIKKIKL